MSERSEVERGLKGSDSEAGSSPPAPGSALILRVEGEEGSDLMPVGKEEPKMCEEKRK